MKLFLQKGVNFDGIKKKDKPNFGNRIYECPVCKGHGKWNAQLDAYGEGKHFQIVCTQCDEFGWVNEGDRDCLHEYRELSIEEAELNNVRHFGRCYHVYMCSKCRRLRTEDSSD